MITYDPAKRLATLARRGLDFEDAAEVFEGLKFTFPDTRAEYGELRWITIGLLRSRMVVIGWTQRGENRRVFSMRKANEREQAKYRQRLS